MSDVKEFDHTTLKLKKSNRHLNYFLVIENVKKMLSKQENLILNFINMIK